jgi:hypothetical protein
MADHVTIAAGVCSLRILEEAGALTVSSLYITPTVSSVEDYLNFSSIVWLIKRDQNSSGQFLDSATLHS